MDRVTDFIRRNPFAQAKGQETEKSSLFKDTWEKYRKQVNEQRVEILGH